MNTIKVLLVTGLLFIGWSAAAQDVIIPEL